MRIILVAVGLCLIAVYPSSAQQLTPEQQAASALGSQLGLTHLQALQQAAQIAELQQELAKAQARVKELEAKEPPK